MKDDGQPLKSSAQRPHSPRVLLALSLRITETIFSSVGGPQLQTHDLKTMRCGPVIDYQSIAYNNNYFLYLSRVIREPTIVH